MNYVGQLYGRLSHKYFPLGVSSSDIDGKDATITAQYELIAKLKADCMTLQKKVEELDGRECSIKNEINCRIEHGADSNGHLEGMWERFYKGTRLT
jgi:hypothetical protein